MKLEFDAVNRLLAGTPVPPLARVRQKFAGEPIGDVTGELRRRQPK